MSRLKALERLLTATAPLGVLGTRPYSIAYAPRFTLPHDRTLPATFRQERATSVVPLPFAADLLDHHYPTERGRHQ